MNMKKMRMVVVRSKVCVGSGGGGSKLISCKGVDLDWSFVVVTLEGGRIRRAGGRERMGGRPQRNKKTKNQEGTSITTLVSHINATTTTSVKKKKTLAKREGKRGTRRLMTIGGGMYVNIGAMGI